jgi:hypothetical protein
MYLLLVRPPYGLDYAFPKDCRLGKEQKGENKVANSATVAAAVATAVNPNYQALLSTLAKFHDKE